MPVCSRNKRNWAALTGASDAAEAPAAAAGGGGGGSSAASSALGDALALASAVCYAGYSVALARALRARAAPGVDLVLGCIGALALVALTPLVVTLHLARVEDLAAVTPAFVGIVLAKGLLDNVLCGVLWAKAVALGGPTLATVALSLTVPLAVVSDAVLLQGRPPGALLSAGCGLTVAGFVAAAFAAPAE